MQTGIAPKNIPVMLTRTVLASSICIIVKVNTFRKSGVELYKMKLITSKTSMKLSGLIILNFFHF